jgi:hypothetical protein
MDDDAEIEFPEGSLEAVEEWLKATDGSIGVCFLCGGRIMSEADLVPGSNRHRCSSAS